MYPQLWLGLPQDAAQTRIVQNADHLGYFDGGAGQQQTIQFIVEGGVRYVGASGPAPDAQAWISVALALIIGWLAVTLLGLTLGRVVPRRGRVLSWGYLAGVGVAGTWIVVSSVVISLNDRLPFLDFQENLTRFFLIGVSWPFWLMFLVACIIRTDC